jgi:DNA/RNA endonuclease G (NUC1)
MPFSKPIMLFFAFSGWTNAFAQHTVTIHHDFYTNLFDTVQCSEIQGFYVQTAARAATSNTKGGHITRTGKFAKFTKDPETPKGCPVDYTAAYKTYNQQFEKGDLQDRIDQGHVNPFQAFDFDSTASLQSMYFTNVCPQISYFNEHQWEQVENHVLNLAPQYGDIKVWTGVLISTAHPKRVGDLLMPDYYWKVVQYTKGGQTVQEAWLGPNNPKNTSTKPADIADSVQHVKKVILQYYPSFNFEF